MSSIGFVAHEFDTTAGTAFSIDFDGDGDLDVLATAGGLVRWLENTDGQGTFARQHSIGYSRGKMIVTDIDGDADWDVGIVTRNAPIDVTWFENADGRGAFTNHRRAGASFFGNLLQTADMDGDGDQDLLVAAPSIFDVVRPELTWWENQDGRGALGAAHLAATARLSIRQLEVADLDGDGDLDIAAVDELGLYWLENENGRGDFGFPHFPPDWAGLPASFQAADLDADGDEDLLFVSTTGDIVWQENVDGKGAFKIRQTWLSAVTNNSPVYVRDFNGDGDMDLVYASASNQITWHAYQRDIGRFAAGQHMVAAESFTIADVADLDGDRDLDILIDQGLAWLKTTQLGEPFEPAQRAPISTPFDHPSPYRVDLDRDGDVDEVRDTTDQTAVSWNEFDVIHNVWLASHPISQGRGPEQLSDVVDLDGDGDADIVTRTELGYCWYETRDVGDSTGDGVFDTYDFVWVYTIGKCESQDKATFEEGDWNGDGVFDSADLVLVFTVGNYASR